MPANLTPISTFTPTITVPVDGDARTGASVQTAFQALANRDEWLKDQLASGVKKVRTVASISALKALTGMAAGELAIIAPSNQPYAVMMFTTVNVAVDNDRWVVAPTAGGGTWYNILGGYATDAGGADGASIRWAVDVPNRIVSITDTFETGIVDTTLSGSAFVDAGLTSGAIAVAAGDKVKIELTTRAFTSGSVGFFARLAAHNGATATAIAGSTQEYNVAAGVEESVCLLGYHNPGSAGTFTYRLQVNGDAADVVRTKPSRRMLVTVVRP